MPVDEVDAVLDELQLASGSVSASPVVSVEPRVRKFHQPVTITLPLPPRSRHHGNAASDVSSLRLLCSMSGPPTSHLTMTRKWKNAEINIGRIDKFFGTNTRHERFKTCLLRSCCLLLCTSLFVD